MSDEYEVVRYDLTEDKFRNKKLRLNEIKENIHQRHGKSTLIYGDWNGEFNDWLMFIDVNEHYMDWNILMKGLDEAFKIDYDNPRNRLKDDKHYHHTIQFNLKDGVYTARVYLICRKHDTLIRLLNFLDEYFDKIRILHEHKYYMYKEMIKKEDKEDEGYFYIK